MKRLLQVMVTILAVLTGGVALAGSANAAPADVTNQKWTCEILPSGDTLCSSLRQVIVQPDTPNSGHYNAVYSACAKYTLSSGKVDYDFCTRGREIHNTTSAGNGGDQSAYTQTYTFSDPATGITYTCTNTFGIVLANGNQVHIRDFTTECNPPLP